MAQRKRNRRLALVKRSGQARFDEDGYEYPGPCADVIFALEPATAVNPEFKRRWGFWTRLIRRAPADPPVEQTATEGQVSRP